MEIGAVNGLMWYSGLYKGQQVSFRDNRVASFGQKIKW